jgi:hypothetical protein
VATSMGLVAVESPGRLLLSAASVAITESSGVHSGPAECINAR